MWKRRFVLDRCVLGDLIGDLTWSPNPMVIKIFSTDTALLKEKATQIAGTIEGIPGVVDVEDGLVVAGPSMRLKTNLAVNLQTLVSAAFCQDKGSVWNIRILDFEFVSDFVLQISIRKTCGMTHGDLTKT